MVSALLGIRLVFAGMWCAIAMTTFLCTSTLGMDLGPRADLGAAMAKRETGHGVTLPLNTAMHPEIILYPDTELPPTLCTAPQYQAVPQHHAAPTNHAANAPWVLLSHLYTPVPFARADTLWVPCLTPPRSHSGLEEGDLQGWVSWCLGDAITSDDHFLH